MVSISWCKGQANPAVWTKSYEDGFYRYLDSVSKPNLPDPDKRAKYVSFIISRLKEEIPNGMQSVSKDSLKNLNIRIGREYALKLRSEGQESGITPYYEKWTPMLERTIRSNFTAINQQTKTIKNIEKFCDCLVENLKKMYPDSISIPLPQKALNKIAIDCKNVDMGE